MKDYSKNPLPLLNPNFSGLYFAITWMFDYLTTLFAVTRGFVETNGFWSHILPWSGFIAIVGILVAVTPYRKYLIPLYVGLIIIGVIHFSAALHNIETMFHNP